MTATLDLRIATPPEIDTILADLDYERWVADTRYRDYRKIAQEARDYVHYDWRTKLAAEQADIAWQLDGWFRGEDTKYLDEAKKIVLALAAKRGVDPAGLLEELLDKAAKKHRREAIKSIKELLASKGRQPSHYDNSDPANWYASTRRIAQEEGLI